MNYLLSLGLFLRKWGANQYFKYKVISVFVCLKLNNSGTAGLIWQNFFLLALSWSRDGFRPKSSGSGIRFFRKSRKTRILGYYLNNLAEIYRYYSPWHKYVLTQINLWIGYPIFRIRKPVFPGKIQQNWAKIKFNSISWCDTSFFIF